MAITPMRLILINVLVLGMFSFLRSTLLPPLEATPELPAPESHAPALRAGRLVERAAERVATSVAVAAREVRNQAAVEAPVPAEPVEEESVEEPAPSSDEALAAALEGEDSLREIAAMGEGGVEQSLALEGELPIEEEGNEDAADDPADDSTEEELVSVAPAEPEVAPETEDEAEPAAPVALVASPLELAADPPVEPNELDESTEAFVNAPETAPESQEDADAAAVEVARAVAVADAVTPGAAGAASETDAEDTEEAEGTGKGETSDAEVPVLPSVAAAAAPPTTLAQYTAGVRLVRGHLKKKDFVGAVAVADSLLDLEDLIGEQRAWLLYLKARAERGRGHLLTAARLYGEAIDHDPPGAHYKNSLAWMMCTSKHPRVRDLDAAVKMAEEAVRDGGARSQYLDTLARAYFEAGRYEDAVLTQRQAVESDPARKAFQNRLDWYRDEAIKIAAK